jgi:hypothetical protein
MAADVGRMQLPTVESIGTRGGQQGLRPQVEEDGGPDNWLQLVVGVGCLEVLGHSLITSLCLPVGLGVLAR